MHRDPPPAKTSAACRNYWQPTNVHQHAWFQSSGTCICLSSLTVQQAMMHWISGLTRQANIRLTLLNLQHGHICINSKMGWQTAGHIKISQHECNQPAAPSVLRLREKIADNHHSVPPPRLNRPVALDEPAALRPPESLPVMLLAYPLADLFLQPELLGVLGDPASATAPELLKGGVAGCPVSKFKGMLPVGVNTEPPERTPEPLLLNMLALALENLIRVCLAAA